jgi:hypothetical protein
LSFLRACALSGEPDNDHARRKFDELAKAGSSALAEEAIRRFAHIDTAESELVGLHDDQRTAMCQELAGPLRDKLRTGLELERRLIADGGSTAVAR